MANCESHIPHINVKVDENDVFEGASLILDVIRPKWCKDRINLKLFTDGITNKLVGCFYGKEEVVLVRVYGNKTDLLIDRDVETRNIKLLHKEGYAPRLFATFANGLAYDYVPGITLTVESVRLPAVWQLVARQLALMHLVDCGADVARHPTLWDKTQKFLDLVPEEFTNNHSQQRYNELILPLATLRTEFEELYAILETLGSPVVFAHNDLLLGNVIHNEAQNCVTFIDYEYASYNYQAYDIGNHFAEFVGLDEVDYTRYPSRKFQLSWLREYLKTYKNSDNIKHSDVVRLYSQVNKFSLASHFFWAIWSLIQAQHSMIQFDFIGYAAIRFREYFSKKDDFLALSDVSS